MSTLCFQQKIVSNYYLNRLEGKKFPGRQKTFSQIGRVEKKYFDMSLF